MMKKFSDLSFWVFCLLVVVFGILFVVLFVLVCLFFVLVLMLVDDNQGWMVLFVNGLVIDGKFLFWFDGYVCFCDDVEEFGVIIICFGVGWCFFDKLSFWGGVVCVIVYCDGLDIDEDCIWQQVIYCFGIFFGGFFSGCSWFEQCFCDDQGDDIGWCFCQFLCWVKLIGDIKFGWFVWNEFFWGFNDVDWGQCDGFDQNCFLFGFIW